MNMRGNDEQVTVNTFQEPYRQGFPNLQRDPDVSTTIRLTFDSAIPQNEEMLYDQLAAWNQNHPHPSTALTYLPGRPSLPPHHQRQADLSLHPTDLLCLWCCQTSGYHRLGSNRRGRAPERLR